MKRFTWILLFALMALGTPSTAENCNDYSYSIYPFEVNQQTAATLTQLDMEPTKALQHELDGRTRASETIRPEIEIQPFFYLDPELAYLLEESELTDNLTYTPVWVDPDDVPGHYTLTTNALRGNHMSSRGMAYVSQGVLYFAWKSFDTSTNTYSVLFTRLIGSYRYGYWGTTFDVIYSGNYPIDDVRLVRKTNDATFVTWLMQIGGYRSVYGSLWNGTCWGTSTSCSPVNLTWPISNWVYGYGLALNPVTQRPGIAFADSLGRVIEREQNAAGNWTGHGTGSWCDVLWSDTGHTVYDQILGAEALYRTNGVLNVIFTGTKLGKPGNVRVRFYNNGWKAYYGLATNVLVVKASALISACFDKLYGRLYIVGQWEVSGGLPMDWFVLQGPTAFQGVGGAAYDWVSAWRGNWPVVDSSTTSRPFAVFLEPFWGETVISFWHATWWGGYGSNPSNRAPTNVSNDPQGQWGGSFVKDPMDKAHVAYTTCTASSPICDTSEIRYTRER